MSPPESNAVVAAKPEAGGGHQHSGEGGLPPEAAFPAGAEGSGSQLSPWKGRGGQPAGRGAAEAGPLGLKATIQ